MTIRDNLGRQKYVFNCSHQGLGDIAEAFDTCYRDGISAGYMKAWREGCRQPTYCTLYIYAMYDLLFKESKIQLWLIISTLLSGFWLQPMIPLVKRDIHIDCSFFYRFRLRNNTNICFHVLNFQWFIKYLQMNNSAWFSEEYPWTLVIIFILIFTDMTVLRRNHRRNKKIV